MNQLPAYIDKEVKKGFAEELIKQKLKSAGYTNEEIADAFHDYQTYIHYQTKQIQPTKKHHSHLFLFIIIFVGIITGILITNTAIQNAIVNLFSEKEITTEADCSNLEFKEKEQCLLRLAALHNDTNYCINVTSKVMKYECKTQVWNKNYCNYLLLTNQPSC